MIEELIRILAGNKGVEQVFQLDASVISVDMGNRTCEVECVSGKAKNKLTVRLMCAVGDGVLVKPTVGSTVGVLLSKSVEPIIYQYSDVDEIVLRGGDLGGLVKVNELVERLNKIENLVNDFSTKYNLHKHTANNTPTTDIFSQTLSNTTVNQLENKTITHGA